MANRQKIMILPQLDDCGGDLSKQWFVYYSYLDPLTDRMKRFKVYKGFTELSTASEKKKHGQNLIKEYKSKLRSGWNPFEDGKAVYEDSLVYARIAKKTGRIRPVKYNWQYHLSEWLAEQKPRLEPPTYTTYKGMCRKFCEWLENKNRLTRPITSFTDKESNEFVNDLLTKGLAKKTVNDYTRLLKSICKYLIKRKQLPVNPWEDIKKFKFESIPPIFFEDIVLKSIKKETQKRDPQLWLFEQFMYYTYIRPKELRFMRIGDINFISGAITVRGEISKNDKTQIIIAPAQLLEMLKKLRYDQCDPLHYIFTTEERPGPTSVNKNYFGNRFRKIRDLLKVSKKYKLYGWKHTGAMKFVEETKDLKAAQMQLRHGSLDQVDAYIKKMSPLKSDTLKNQFPEI